MAKIVKSFRKHGTFIYQVPATIADYGSAELVIEAMRRAGITHAWVRIHGVKAYSATQKRTIAAFIKALTDAGIDVAGWGWCQGEDPVADARLALRELGSFGLSAYIADIEQGVSEANWTASEIVRFCDSVRQIFNGSFGITTFPLIDWHEPQLMKAALPYVDMFNPQVYWHDFPNRKMVAQFRRPDGSRYTVREPSEYAELCLDRWDLLMGEQRREIVLTGQAYWGESEFTQPAAEEKLERFLATWTKFGRVIGLNWWHFGGKAMSHRMLDAITKAKLGSKNYK